MWMREGIDKNIFPEGSLYEILKNRPETLIIKSPTVQSLWIGNKLSPMEQISIASFLKHGHEYHLYTYNPIEGLPDGVILKDANDIIPLSLYDYNEFSSLAAFSDFFRHKLLLEKGGWWVDTDIFCLRNFDFKEDYVFSSEVINTGGTSVTSGYIKAPANSPIMKFMWDECQKTNPKNIKWGDVGPALVKCGVDKFSLQKFVKNPEVFCPINPWEIKKFIEPSGIDIPKVSYAIHLWNEMWSKMNVDKREFPLGSFYDNIRRELNVSVDENSLSLEFDDIMRRVSI
jgi:hypothetical protein